MGRWFSAMCASTVIGLLTATLPAAAPLDAALQEQLLGLFASYNQAIAAGRLHEAEGMRSAEVRQEMAEALNDEKNRQDFLASAMQEIPDKVEVRHASLAKDGNHATILTVASKTMPPGSVMRAEMTLDFVKEQGAWKYGEQMFGADPDKIVACRDDKFEPIAAYDQDEDSSLEGPIVRVAFEADHTLVVLRVVDEENCGFLPERAVLEKAGLDPATLVPYAIVEIEGFPHKSDKQKVWIDKLRVREED
jgi:hypothetical protein